MRILAVTYTYPPSGRIGAWLALHGFLRHAVRDGHEVTVFASNLRCPAYTHDGVCVETGIRGRSHAIRLAATADVVVGPCADRLATEAAARHRRPRVAVASGPHAEPDGDLTVWNAESNRQGRPGIVCHPPVDIAAHPLLPLGERTGRAVNGDVTLVNCSKPKGVMTAWRLAEAQPQRSFLGVLGGYGEQVKPRAANWESIPTQRDMRTVWDRTRVLLMPSEFEAWGMVGIEAMADGIPVIAHPTPGLRESLGDAGIFADRDDTTAWADALDALDDPTCYLAASRRSRARAAELDPTPDLERFVSSLETLCG